MNIQRELIRLLLRISRAGYRKGWTDELVAVWEQAEEMALSSEIPQSVISEIRGAGSPTARSMVDLFDD